MLLYSHLCHALWRIGQLETHKKVSHTSITKMAKDVIGGLSTVEGLLRLTAQKPEIFGGVCQLINVIYLEWLLDEAGVLQSHEIDRTNAIPSLKEVLLELKGQAHADTIKSFLESLSANISSVVSISENSVSLSENRISQLRQQLSKLEKAGKILFGS